MFVDRSQHEEIELVSTEEFFNEAPSEISRPHLTKDDPHQLTLARLDWELEQRKRSDKPIVLFLQYHSLTGTSRTVPNFTTMSV